MYSIEIQPYRSPVLGNHQSHISVDLLIISNKWKHTICDLWWLVSVVHHNGFKAYRVCISTSVLLLMNGIVLYGYVAFVIHLSFDGDSHCLHFLSVMNYTAILTFRYSSWVHVFSFILHIYLGEELLGYMKTVHVNFGRICQSYFFFFF